MKFFPLRVIILCMVLPLIIYSFITNLADNYLDDIYQKKIENIFLDNIDQVLKGKDNLKSAIAENIESFLKADFLIKTAFIEIDVVVINDDGKIIYPSAFLKMENINYELYNNSIDTARKSFELINSGLNIQTETYLSRHTRVALMIFNLVVFTLIIVLIYFKSAKRAFLAEKLAIENIEFLKNEEERYKQIANDLKKERESLFDQIGSLNEKYEASRENEEDMFEEMVALEEKLHSYIEHKKDNTEDNRLKERCSGVRKKDFNYALKRFEILYKNIIIHKKAYQGFMELEDDLKIKAEEVILQLNNEPEKVIIKRKVFSGKKNKSASFEVIFAYSGRLYFRRTSDNKVEVLVIGTKKTQNKDMDCLHNL